MLAALPVILPATLVGLGYYAKMVYEISEPRSTTGGGQAVRGPLRLRNASGVVYHFNSRLAKEHVPRSTATAQHKKEQVAFAMPYIDRGEPGDDSERHRSLVKREKSACALPRNAAPPLHLFLSRVCLHCSIRVPRVTALSTEAASSTRTRTEEGAHPAILRAA